MFSIDTNIFNFYIKIKKLYSNSIMPTRGSNFAAGADLYARIGESDDCTLTIAPHTTAMIDTGLAIQVPQGTFGGIFARSGLSTKQGLRPANCVGVIDSDYTGTCFVALHNDTNEEKTIKQGDRIAQIIPIVYQQLEWVEVDEFEQTERGNQGFGSSGK